MQMLLSTAIIKLQGPDKKWVNVRALLDGGSEVNIMTRRLAASLRLESFHDPCLLTGLGITQNSSNVSVNANFSSRHGSYHNNLTFNVVDEITVPLPHKYIPTKTWHIPDKIVPLLADPTFFTPGTIDLLIGQELFYKLHLKGFIQLGPSLPDLVETVFGWVVAGAYRTNTASIKSHNTQKVSMHLAHSTTDNILQSFWEQEELPPSKPLLSPADTYCEVLYITTTKQDHSGRYIVNLPLQIAKLDQLGNLFNIVYRCLLQLESRMQKDTNLYKQYNAFIDEFVRLGHAHYVDSFSAQDKHAFYMPHFPIIKPDNVSTKVRAVFNASASPSTGLSLNDILKVPTFIMISLILYSDSDYINMPFLVTLLKCSEESMSTLHRNLFREWYGENLEHNH